MPLSFVRCSFASCSVFHRTPLRLPKLMQIEEDQRTAWAFWVTALENRLLIVLPCCTVLIRWQDCLRGSNDSLSARCSGMGLDVHLRNRHIRVISRASDKTIVEVGGFRPVLLARCVHLRPEICTQENGYQLGKGDASGSPSFTAHLLKANSQA